MAATYVIQRFGTGFRWALRSDDGVRILSSGTYVTRHGAEQGIASCRANSTLGERYARLKSPNGLPYFALRARNGKSIGVSEIHGSVLARDAAVIACMRSGALAAIVDETRRVRHRAEESTLLP